MSTLIARLSGVLLALFCLQGMAISIPKSLEEWQPWVLEKHPELNCPFLFNDAARTCSWPSQLQINADSSGASFTQQVEVFRNDWIALPGNSSFWPQNVKINSSAVALRDQNNLPEVYLTPGVYQITGEIRWSEIPRTLPIPAQTGIVQLRLNGKDVPAAALQNNNELWLSANENLSAQAHQDSFTLRVFRKIEDTIPLRITTQLQLDISGKERELQLGQFLLEGFAAMELDSELPARIESNGNLRIQAKPGSWLVTLVSQSSTPRSDLNYKATSELWPQQEVWVFSAARHLRSVQISGAQTLDPQQTQLPEDWKSLPAYLVTPETHFKIEELQRGENADSTGKLTLNRQAWLSFDGSKFIQRDRIEGQLQSTRMETLPPYQLSNATIDGKAQLITHLENSPNTGIELRQRDININGVGQLPRSLTLPVSGWNQDFNSVSTQLFLPPGWSLLTATGTSNESNSWISKWSLWDIFLVLIIVVATARTMKPIYGALAAVTLIVIYQRDGAPVFIWLNLVAAITLATFVSGQFKQFIVRYTYFSFLLLALITLPFTVQEARSFFNPTLEQDKLVDGNGFFHVSSDKKKAVIAEPVASPAPEMETMDEAMPIMKSKSSYSSTLSKAGTSKPVPIANDYDINQQTQTGLATPEWDNNRAWLSWSGPVKAEETSKVFLISPAANRLGYILSVFLPLLLAWFFLRHFLRKLGKNITIPKLNPGAYAAILPGLLLLGLGTFTVEPAKAEVIIDQTILNELEARLTKAPACLPNCAAIESVALSLSADELSIDMLVHSTDLIALPLPADREQWWPNQVNLDNKTASLVQDDEGQLLVSLPKGRHNLSIKANLQGRDRLHLEFPLQLHNLVSKISGWELSGAPTAIQSSQSLQLQRVERSKTETVSERLRPDPIAPFVIVRRTLNLNLTWTLTTSVTRVAPAVGGITLEIPLLQGESPLTTSSNGNGKVSVHLEANQDSFEWSSNLKQQSPLQLQAPQNVPWVEIWVLDVASIWHTHSKGIAPIQLAQHEKLPVWQPWPGETLEIEITRPEASKGNYVTVDSAHLDYKPGNRSNTSHLRLEIRSNQGGQYNFTLPQQARLSSVQIDNAPLTLTAVEGLVKIPLRPGKQYVDIAWETVQGLGIFSRSPQFNLEHGSSNQTIVMELPDNRWPLFSGGPLVGPSILFWGMLVIAVIISLALGRSQLTPLKSHQWVLLSLGICTISFAVFILVALWLIALQQRGKLQSISSARKFKLLQFALFSFSLIALLSLIGSIPTGLLGSPEMHVLGNDSYSGWFRWYQDYSDAAFPSAWVISLPLWCYKVVILLWSLWLASALLQWIRWGWQQLSHQALWHAPASIIAQAPANTPQ
ncbi:MAG TPA: hypothetical protein VN030_07400 [Cellvibrio sp.]|nr:hypothetical protein [Cellvibrio sp.]